MSGRAHEEPVVTKVIVVVAGQQGEDKPAP